MEYEDADLTGDALFKNVVGKETLESTKIRSFFIESITGIHEEKFIVKNPDMFPQFFDGKEVIFDSFFEGEHGLYIIDMQKGKLTKRLITRFHYYKNVACTDMLSRGEDYSKIKPVYMIVFTLSYKEGSEKLILEQDLYYTDTHERVEHYLGSFFIVQIPYIDKVAKQKNNQLTEFEASVYYMLHSHTNEIYWKQEKGVVEMLEMIRNRFFRVDLGEKLAMMVSDFPDTDGDDDRIPLQEVEEIRRKSIAQGIQEGIEQGKAEGILENQRDLSISIFKRKYPQKDCSFLEKMTSAQYEIVINMLLDDKSVEEIRDKLKE